EFLMFNGIWNTVSNYRVVFTVLAGLYIILGAVYTLTMIQKIFFGDTNTTTEVGKDIGVNERIALGIVVLLIVIFGVYPQPLLNLTNNFVDVILKEASVANLMGK
ncbi:MAG TPA: NADH-quinone oxidoreductase subunit M, partial [Flavisolibacter sp.]|nr:NADH-quinone oxidoreductase subunit M [Flavisolibacter sp.]